LKPYQPLGHHDRPHRKQNRAQQAQ
jgi:hypothetical protein